MDIIETINNFAQNNAWIGFVAVILVSIHTGMKALRDAIDTTPETDDNWFEKVVTIMGKATKYLVGIRPKK